MAKAMYRGINNSIATTTAALISASDTAIAVVDASVLPPGPNIATLGAEDNAELVQYSAIAGNMLTGCLRAFNGTLAQMWPQETLVYRAYTEYDHQAFIENINETSGALGGKSDVGHTHAQYLTAETDPTVPAWAKAAAKPTYTAAETGAVPTSRKVAGKELSADVVLVPVDVGAAAAVHTHAQYLTEEADPTVPAWAKAAAKPAYTADEVGAVTLAEGKALAAQVSAVIVQVTGSRVLALTDAGKTIEVDSAGAATITIPADTTVNFPIGTEIEITQEGTGEVTVAAAGGVTLRSAGDKVMIAEQYTAAVLKKRAANDWRMWGALK